MTDEEREQKIRAYLDAQDAADQRFRALAAAAEALNAARRTHRAAKKASGAADKLAGALNRELRAAGVDTDAEYMRRLKAP
jgi:hypothetical protein